jgi:CheY-like chemotaxis protein
VTTIRRSSALRTLLGGLPRFHWIGEAVDGSSCRDLLATNQPDILILDVSMPGGGPGLVHAARAACPATRIVMHSGRSDAPTRQAMLDAGADAYVVKTGRLGQLTQAMDGPAHTPGGSGTNVRELAHTAHFLHEAEWMEQCRRFVRTALVGDGRLIMLASSAHRVALQAAPPDSLARARDEGRVLIYAAEQTMRLLIPRGRVDAGYFRQELKPAVEDFRIGSGVVSFWGEMVGLTWATGNVVCALELEMLWNAVAVDSPMIMSCPYPVTTQRPFTAADLAAIRSAHSHTFGPPTG